MWELIAQLAAVVVDQIAHLVTGYRGRILLGVVLMAGIACTILVVL